ncbi:MAG: nicotinamide-nucleotide adenylyltransferase [Thaumarchaeota archaeon]|nr:nicotinamide-nucleotide adenylyltransferase [Nitrososphaerota archaeon]
MRALIIGRFQPFHKGHLQLVKRILKDCDELVIAIASAQFNFIEKDPFTAGERIMMIHETLKESNIDLTKCYIVPLVNDENNARWIGHLRSFLPHFDIVYTGNPYVAILMKNSEIIVKKIKFHYREKYNASKIRRLMLKGSAWESLVPYSVVNVIKKVDGVKRLKVIIQSDTKPQEW